MFSSRRHFYPAAGRGLSPVRRATQCEIHSHASHSGGREDQEISARPHTEGDSRSGITLIIVLGFLALLLIMAVGFSISNRIERLTAGNYSDFVKSRQMVSAALARAMDRIDGDSLTNKWIYPPWNTLFSGPGSGGSNTPPLMDGYITNYAPGHLVQEMRSRTSQWDYVYSGTNLLGRVGFVIADCSGLFDVNRGYDQQDGVLARNNGDSVNEIQLDTSLFLDITPQWTNFFWNKSHKVSGTYPSGRIETICDIWKQFGFGFGGSQYPLKANYTHPSNLVSYSYFPVGWADGKIAQTSLVIRSLNDIITNKLSVTAAFQSMGIVEADSVVSSLIEYLDPDSTFQSSANLYTFAAERTPLINEIVVSNRITGTGPVYTNEFQVWVELFYPFGRASTNALTMTVGARYTGANPPEANPKPIVATDFAISPVTWTTGMIRAYAFPSATTWSNVVFTNAGPPDLSAAVVQVPVILKLGGSQVDGFGPLSANQPKIMVGQAFTAGGSVIPSAFSMGVAADDPRLNWDASNSNQWRQMPPNKNSMSTMNDVVPNVMTYNLPGRDGSWQMYVGNSSNLASVGELGFLLYSTNKPWQTISLLTNSPNFFPVLDRFTVWTNAVRHGQINPNTRTPNVLATVFNKMPIEYYPGAPNAVTVTAANASTFATQIKASRTFTNLSEMGDSTAILTAFPMANNPMLQESVIRNSCGLLSTRQNLFSVLLIDQALDSKTNVLAEQRATALLWRDPYTTSVGGPHKWIVRYLKVVTE